MALNLQFPCKCLSTVGDSFATAHHQSQPSMLVVNKFILRPHSLPFPFLSPPWFFPKSRIFCSLSGTAVVLCSALDHQSLPYGPSLRKGRNPFTSIPSPISIDSQPFLVQENQGNDINLFNEDCFTRVFNVAALRVPAENCFALENRLRGHLLNWPRIRNIARVPGDEIDEELKKLFDNDHSNSDTSGDDGNALADLNRRIYGKAKGDGEPLSPVLYRDKLARTFNSRGFVRFRNLAKLSRPRRGNTKTKVEEKEGGKKHGLGKNEMSFVEVVGEDEKRSSQECDMSGLLGDAFFSTKWRGPTRLLLLDERHADSEIDDMPQAIKVSILLSLVLLISYIMISILKFH